MDSLVWHLHTLVSSVRRSLRLHLGSLFQGALACEDAEDLPRELSAEDFRAKHNITVQGDGEHVPDPAQNFEDVKFPNEILRKVKRHLELSRSS